MNNFRVWMVMAIVMVLGFGTYSFAAGKGNRAGKGGGWLKNCPAAKNLSNEDRQKVLAEIQAFRNDTDSIRQQIRQKKTGPEK
ncbi:MAG: periplasmic heavy metal sensor [Desulfobacteraceae bacterium]|nr:periplasmic heavy metal sensor [Desulfobacteraceae bacterium]